MLRNAEQQGGSVARPEAVQLRARRSPKLVAAGILAVALGALGAAALYSSSNEQSTVVSIAHAVPRGQVVTESDLALVQVPRDFAIDTLGGDAMDALIGQTALTDLPVGSFPLPGHVGEDPLPEGEALVGLRLVPGQLPMSPMPVGTVVELVDITTPTDPTAEAPAEAPDAASPPVQAVVAGAPLLLDDGTSTTLDVRVAGGEAPRVARLAATGQLAVVVVREP